MNKKVFRFLVILAFLFSIATVFPWNWPMWWVRCLMEEGETNVLWYLAINEFIYLYKTVENKKWEEVFKYVILFTTLLILASSNLPDVTVLDREHTMN